VYLDPSRVRQPAYRGTHFKVLGPLNAARPPQGHPVLVQSDVDPLARSLAADVLIVDAGSGAAAGGALRSVRFPRAQWTTRGIDELERSFRAGAIEGIHLVLGEAQQDLQRFSQDVLPELTGRALLSGADRGTTLRARLGLRVPGARS
jgi:alkanesulfonate monooxygenase SsuD/methylene tetrahydromethanopterin reductase-like flavin-dependent oxidoreductase (luciferase family)